MWKTSNCALKNLTMQLDCNLMRLYHFNQSTDDPWHTIFISLYAFFTFASFTCNALLLLALYWHNHKRREMSSIPNTIRLRHLRSSEKTRDILIAHLATLDLLLSFTMPFTALDVLSKFWPLGPDTEILCRLAKSVPSTVVYSSSMIIVVIAINCYRQILCLSKPQLSPANLAYITPAILVIAIGMSSPIFYYARLYSLVKPAATENQLTAIFIMPNDTDMLNTWSSPSFNTTPPNQVFNMSHFVAPEVIAINSECKGDEDFVEEDWSHVTYCIEDWPFNTENDLEPMNRLYYSIFSLTFQLIIPGIVISLSYFLIYRKLQKQSITRRRMLQNQNTERIERENNRSKRRNKLMAIISTIFLISWLPLSIIGTLLDAYPNILGNDIEIVTIVFVSCHLIGMSSACANPIIYGYTNKYIRKGKYSKLYIYPKYI